MAGGASKRSVADCVRGADPDMLRVARSKTRVLAPPAGVNGLSHMLVMPVSGCGCEVDRAPRRQRGPGHRGWSADHYWAPDRVRSNFISISGKPLEAPVSMLQSIRWKVRLHRWGPVVRDDWGVIRFAGAADTAAGSAWTRPRTRTTTSECTPVAHRGGAE